MKYLPLACIAAVLLLCLIPFCGGGHKNDQPQQTVVGTSQLTQQQTYQTPQYEEIIEGSLGQFYVKDVEDAMYKEGFRDGFDGRQGWWIVDNFDRRYQSVIGKPENKKQKDDYKKYRDRMYKAYTKGAEEGFEPQM